MLAGSGAVHARQAVRSRLGVAPSRSDDGIGCPVRVAGRREPAKGELFSPPTKLPQLSPEVQQRMVRLLARMLNEHLNRQLRFQAEVIDE